jgi:UDP-N-acetylglucosamine transferase subunit ALG13
MIVVTVGTHEQPFDRLVRAASALDGDEPLLMQYGTSKLAHGHGEWIDFLSFDELAERAAAARAFVCHAGVGSIVLGRRCGHRPIVVPRRPELGEHVDDHQLSLARRLAAAGMVTLVEDERELAAAVRSPAESTPAGDAGALRGPDALAADVRTLLDTLGAAQINGRAA